MWGENDARWYNIFRTSAERNTRKNKAQLTQSNRQVLIITPKTADEGKSVMGCLINPELRG